jgi:hypothetical protein
MEAIKNPHYPDQIGGSVLRVQRLGPVTEHLPSIDYRCKQFPLPVSLNGMVLNLSHRASCIEDASTGTIQIHYFMCLVNKYI